jgi:hypothetical protein
VPAERRARTSMSSDSRLAMRCCRVSARVGLALHAEG